MAKRTGKLRRPSEIYEAGVVTAGAALRPAGGPLPCAARVQRRVPGRGRVGGRAAVHGARAPGHLSRRPRRRPEAATALERGRKAFEAAMDDDLAVSPALGAVFELVRDLNRRIDDRSLSTGDAQRAAVALRDLDRVLGVMEPDEAIGADAVGVEVPALLEARIAARSAKDWARSDSLRDELAGLGVGGRGHPRWTALEADGADRWPDLTSRTARAARTTRTSTGSAAARNPPTGRAGPASHARTPTVPVAPGARVVRAGWSGSRRLGTLPRPRTLPRRPGPNRGPGADRPGPGPEQGEGGAERPCPIGRLRQEAIGQVRRADIDRAGPGRTDPRGAQGRRPA